MSPEPPTSPGPGPIGADGVTAPMAGALGHLPTRGRRARHIIAVGGGRGGLGKTLLTVNLGVYLAQLGRSVTLWDADPFGSGMHTMLGLHQPPLASPDDLKAGRAPAVDTTVPGLRVMPAAYDGSTLSPRRPGRVAYWLAQVAAADSDYAVINLGSSLPPAALDMLSDADVSLCVTVPEPSAISATYRMLRGWYGRCLRRSLMRDRIRLRVVERALTALPPLPTPPEIIAQIARFDKAIANHAAAILGRMRAGLVVCKTRLRRDLDLGPAMVELCERYLAIKLESLGHVEYDDAVWHTARRLRPLLTDAPTSKSARDIERVARRIVATLATPSERWQPSPTGNLLLRMQAPMTLYDVLNVPRTAVDEDIRRAYRRQSEIFAPESLPIVSLVDEAGVRAELARIQEAHDTLLDSVRKRAYDLSTFPEHEHADRAGEVGRRRLTDEELAATQAALAREITPETAFTGPLLRRVREALGIELGDIADQTKISPMHLRAIETEEYSALPARVYVSGFLKQIAKALDLDPTQVSRSYLQRLRASTGSEPR